MNVVARLMSTMLSSCVLLLVRAYQVVVSPWLGPCCRFHPSCSQYCADAVRRFGVLKGLWLGMVRVCKCHPFHPGGVDPVPDPAASAGGRAAGVQHP